MIVDVQTFSVQKKWLILNNFWLNYDNCEAMLEIGHLDRKRFK